MKPTINSYEATPIFLLHVMFVHLDEKVTVSN